MHKITLPLLLTLFIVACGDLPASGEFSADCSYTLEQDNAVVLRCHPTGLPIATLAASPSNSPTIAPNTPTTSAATKTPSPTLTPTVTPQVNLPNLFHNGGFEAPYIELLHPDGFFHIVAEHWTAWYCDGCPAPMQGAGNPVGLLQRRPEYNPAPIAGDPFRVYAGKTSQHWFGFYGTYTAGIYQTVDTIAGQTCTVTAQVMSWSGDDTSTDPHKSKLTLSSDKANSEWRIIIGLHGETTPINDNDMLYSRGFGYGDGIYDKFAQISYTFAATGSKTTVFFQDRRLWPVRNNDAYIDTAALRCTN